MDSFRDVPEFFEVELGESLTARTETLASFRELGPPDLCHVVKSTGKAGQKDVGSYHYVSGVDASSSASLAAYLNSLTYALEDNSAWFSKSTAWKVRNGCYCCFNAFSRVDMRVDVKIPGGVNAYVVDLRGERHEATPELWQETFLSAILRAVLYADDANYRLAGYRKLDPITSTEGEQRFLHAAEALFMKGWQLGSDPEIQVASVVSNHLTSGILKYFGDSFRYDQAVNLFEKMYAREPEVSSLLATAYIGMNEEVKAANVITTALRENPQSYTLLHVQCDFLRSKGKPEWAVRLAREAVNCAPSEFTTWAKLTEVYIDLEMYDSALLTLNSCPMFTYNERDLHRMPQPARTHLPIKQFIADSNILDEESARDTDADLALLRLPAPGLRGTFARAYALLAKLVSKIGWDELLKTRSLVFVMEEEYRAQKATAAASAQLNGDHEGSDTDGKVVMEDGEVRESKRFSVRGKTKADEAGATPKARSVDQKGAEEADDDASVRAHKSPTSTATNGASSAASTIPSITLSTEEKDRQKEVERLRGMGVDVDQDNSSDPGSGSGTEDGTDDNTQEVTFAAYGSGGAVVRPPLEKPETAAAAAGGGDDQDATDDTHASTLVAHGAGVGGEREDGGFSFTNKRLCERWLDNLFMVLYEDLRIWTIFRAEVAHFKTQHVAYRKTSTEWEILGDLGMRLHHKEEAKEAYLRCLDGKFSAKAWMKLLEMHADEGDLQRSLNAAIRLTAYQHRWYQESSYPTGIAHHLYKLGQTHGHAKISYTILSMGLPDGLLNLMQGYLNYGRTFKVEGHDF